MTLSRILAAMLATLALLTPTAMAQPIEGPVDMHQSTAEAAARQRAQLERKQDLRMPDTRDAAARPSDHATQPKLGPPTWPAYPTTLVPTRTTVVETTGDDGIDWGTIGIGVALSMLGFAAIAGVSRRGRPRRRERFAG
jgi:hypothetical protein